MMNMTIKRSMCSLAVIFCFSAPALAVTEIPFWHSMEAELGTEVDSLAQRFNQSQDEYKIVPVYKGDYEQSLAAGIAAFRAGKAPAILQVYEVGTATMMQAKQAVKPVYQVFKEAGIPLMNPSLFPLWRATTPTTPRANSFPSRSTVLHPFCITTKMPLRKRV